MPRLLWVAIAITAAVVVLAVVLAILVLRRRKPSTVQVLNSVAIDGLHDFLLPNGMGGQIHLEHLLLTAQGLVVVDIKEFIGRLFGSDRMEQWTVVGPEGRFLFPNPQATLYDRVAAVRRLVRDDVPVHGQVLFPVGAEFSGGRPTAAISPGEFAERYSRPDKAELEAVKETLRTPWNYISDASQKPA